MGQITTKNFLSASFPIYSIVSLRVGIEIFRTSLRGYQLSNKSPTPDLEQNRKRREEQFNVIIFL